jgi:hypothetical protein
LQETYKGDFMGTTFEGVGTTGYDRFKKKFVFSWIDNMGTGIMNSEGDYDPKAKTFTYSYQFDCPFMGKDVKARDVVTILNENEHTFAMFRAMSKGGEFKMMEISYSRMKKN